MNAKTKAAAREVLIFLKKATKGKNYRELHQALTPKNIEEMAVKPLAAAGLWRERCEQKYQALLPELTINDFVALKALIRTKVIDSMTMEDGRLSMSVALLKLAASTDNNLLYRAIIDSPTTFNQAIINTLERAADWSQEDERQLHSNPLSPRLKKTALVIGGITALGWAGKRILKKMKGK